LPTYENYKKLPAYENIQNKISTILMLDENLLPFKNHLMK